MQFAIDSIPPSPLPSRRRKEEERWMCLSVTSLCVAASVLHFPPLADLTDWLTNAVGEKREVGGAM